MILKPTWKYESKCCNNCSRKYTTDNMLTQQEGRNIYIWYCIRCYNLLKQS